MENTNIQQTGNHAPNTSGAVVPINDLFIDLRFSPDVPMTVENCPHFFTMIGYVSQMRRSNRGASNPFPGQELPPLPVQNQPRGCPLCLTSNTGGASTSRANGESTPPIPINVTTMLNDVFGDDNDDDAVVPVETPAESPTLRAIDEEMVPIACNTDTEMEPVEPAGNDEAAELNTDTAMEMCAGGDVRHLQETAKNSNDGVRIHQENAEAREMDVDGNGTDEDEENDDFLTLREIQQATSLRRVARVVNVNSDDPNEVVVPDTVEPVLPPVEREETNNAAAIPQEVSSDGSCHEKAKKTRFVLDVLHDTESKKTFRCTDESWLRLIDSSGATTSALPNGPSAINRTRKNKRALQEGGGSSRKSEASTSRGRASGPSGSRLNLGNKADRVKRKAAKTPILVTKKTKSVPSRISEPNRRGNGSKRCSLSSTMSASNSFRSPSDVAGPSNHAPALQIPDPNENVVQQPAEQLVRRAQLLDLNESILSPSSPFEPESVPLNDPAETDTANENGNEGPSNAKDGQSERAGVKEAVEVLAQLQYQRTRATASSHIDNIRRLGDLPYRMNAESPAAGSSTLNGLPFRNPRNDGGTNIPSTSNGAGRSHLSSGVTPSTPKTVPQSSDPRPRGITISDIKEDELRRTREAQPSLSIARTLELINRRLQEPPEPEDHIPAMQLLSLMNGTATWDGPNPVRNRFLDNEARTPPGFDPNANRNPRPRDISICPMNRNPAEFSIPEEGNQYSVHGDDIRISRGAGPSGSNPHGDDIRISRGAGATGSINPHGDDIGINRGARASGSNPHGDDVRISRGVGVNGSNPHGDDIRISRGAGASGSNPLHEDDIRVRNSSGAGASGSNPQRRKGKETADKQ